MKVLVPEETSIKKTNAYDQVLEFPKDRYPETGKHITDAIKEGHSEVCTIDRGGAADRRKLSLAHHHQKKGMIVMNGQWRCVKKAEKERILNI